MKTMFALAIAGTLAVAGCSGGPGATAAASTVSVPSASATAAPVAPTPIIVYVTPAPTETASATASASPSAPAGGIGHWTVGDVQNDPITGKPSAVSTLSATTGTSNVGTPITLFIRCKDGNTDVYVAWGDYLGSDNLVSVTSRLDDAAPSTDTWSESTAHTATFYGSDSPTNIKFAQSLFGHKQLAARITPYNVSPVTAVFDLGGIENAVANVRKACSW